jgi:hypothetical protein
MIARVNKTDLPSGLIDNVMKSVFNGSAGEHYYRFDFAYLFHDENSKPVSFAFLKELTSEDIYIDFGGTFPGERGTVSLRNVKEMVSELLKTYKAIFAHVHNKNYPMLKLFFHVGFEIIGTRVKKDGKIFCELKKELGE